MGKENKGASKAALMNDHDLIRACVKRQAGAWDEFINRFARLIYFSIHRTLSGKHYRPSPEEIEDLFNDVMVHLIKDDCRKLKLYRGDEGCSPATWIRTISVRYVLDYLRSRARMGEMVNIEIEGVSLELSLSNPVIQPDEHLEEREEVRLYQAAVAALDENDRYFMDLYYSKSLEPEIVARTMGISVKTVYSRVNRLKAKINEEIAKVGRK